MRSGFTWPRAIAPSETNLFRLLPDVVAILYPSASKASYSKYLSKVPAEWKGKKSILTPGGKQTLTTLFEPGLYCLVGRSDSSLAVPFQRWLYEDVLPSIRKTGGYSINNHNSESRLAEDLMLADYAARCAQNAGVDKNVTEQIKLESLMTMYPERKKLLKPQKEAIADSNPIPDKPMTATEVGRELAARLGYPKISARKVNNKLLQLGYQVSVTRRATQISGITLS